MASSSSRSEALSASNMSDDSWQGIRSIQRDAECQTDHLPFMMTLADIIEEDRLSWARAQAADVAAPSQASVVAAQAQAAAHSRAQPPAQLPQLGKTNGYFQELGDRCGRWGIANGDTRGSSGSGKRFRR